MRSAKTAALAIAIILLAGAFAPPATAADVSFGVFYSNLTPHGSWLVSAQYGRVWQPSEYRPGWNPYYDGHWVYTDVGWTWISDYSWGAIPYHYGTWVADPGFGWVWVPGTVWAPAWVVFRTGPDYIGWAPVSPSFSVGVSVGFGAPDSNQFVFVSAGDFLAPRVGTRVVPVSQTNVIINKTKIVNNNITIENNVVVNRGPDVGVVERATGRRVDRVAIERVSGVTAGSRVTRADIAVNPQRAKQGLRVAEPVPATSPLPQAGERRGSESPAAGASPSVPAPGTEQKGNRNGRGNSPAGKGRDGKHETSAAAPKQSQGPPQAPELGRQGGAPEDRSGARAPDRNTPHPGAAQNGSAAGPSSKAREKQKQPKGKQPAPTDKDKKKSAENSGGGGF